MKFVSNTERRMVQLLAVILLLGGAVAVSGCSGEKGGSAKEPDSAMAQKKERKVLYWRAPMDPTYISDKPGKSPMGMDLVPVYEGEEGAADTTGGSAAKSGDTAGKKILYWRAPMDPTYISDKPGKSPMGMDLIPVYEGEQETGGPAVVIDPVTIQNMGVQTALVRKIDLRRAIRTVGYLDYNEEMLQRVNIKFSGWVEELFVDETGQRVRKGQPMLSIYSPDLVSTQEEYLLAYRNAKKLTTSSFVDIAGGSTSLLESSRRRLLYWDISEKQIRELEESGKVRKTVTLYAPSNGVVIKKMVERGARVVPGMDIYQLADLSTLWVYGQIYQYEVPFVRVGQPVQVRVSYIPGRTYDGKVDYVYPFLDEKTRNVSVRIVVPNPHLELKPQMYATVDFSSSIGSNVIAIPSDAVIRTGTRNVAFVALGGGKFEPRDVVLGPEGQDNLVQVIAGVRPGEQVVTSAQFMIDSESRLKEAIQKMLEAKKQGAAQAVPDDGHGSGPGSRMEDGSSLKGESEQDHGPHTENMSGEETGHQEPRDAGGDGHEGHGGMEQSTMKEPTMNRVVDPVCKMSITPDERLSHMFNGKTYYFCCVADMQEFRDNPRAFVAD